MVDLSNIDLHPVVEHQQDVGRRRNRLPERTRERWAGE